MAQIRWLGATPAENVQAKFALAVWAKSPEGGPSSPILDYGFQAGDYTDTWTVRDGIMLNAFSKWWNKSGKTPQLDEGVTIPGGGVITADPSLAHLHALSQWAIPLPSQGGGGQSPSKIPPPKPTNWPAGAQWPFPKPDWWPAGFDWPPVGTETPPAWPTVWPPPLPAGWPTNVPFPLPPAITAPQFPAKLPPAPTPGTPPGPVQPPLPPPPPPVGPKKTTEKKSSSNLIWWVLGGVAVVGAVLMASSGSSAGASSGTRSPNPRQPTPKRGYSYKFSLKLGTKYRRSSWRSASDEDWDMVVYTPTGKERLVGTRMIDGVTMNVWRGDTGYYIAQTRIGSLRWINPTA